MRPLYSIHWLMTSQKYEKSYTHHCFSTDMHVSSPLHFIQVFCKKVSDSHLWFLVTFLLEGLVDYQAHSSSGACVVLNNIVKLRGATLGEQVTTDVWLNVCIRRYYHRFEFTLESCGGYEMVGLLGRALCD